MIWTARGPSLYLGGETEHDLRVELGAGVWLNLVVLLIGSKKNSRMRRASGRGTSQAGVLGRRGL